MYWKVWGPSTWSYGSEVSAIYAISAYHHWCCEFESWSWWGVQHYVIKFVSDLRQIGGFLWVVWFPPRYNWNIVTTIKWWYAWQSCWRSSIISSAITGRLESVHFWHLYLMIAGCIVTESWGNGLPGSHFVKSNIRLWVYLMNVIPETRRKH